MRYGHVWFGMAGMVVQGLVMPGAKRRGMAGKVSYGWFVSGVLGSV